MTNNPTIDGVSLLVPIDLLERVSVLGLSVTADQSAAIVELRALLDAPAVERQEHAICSQIQALLDIDARGALAPHGIGGLARDVLTKAQSTITQLQARVAELESGRGEPVAWLAEAIGPDGTAYRRTSSTTQITMRDAKYAWGEGVVSKYEIKIQPLYTAPQAPVAVVADERAEFVNWVRRDWPQAPLSLIRDLLPKDDPHYGEYCDERLQRAWVGWQARACLDATAALNGERAGTFITKWIRKTCGACGHSTIFEQKGPMVIRQTDCCEKCSCRALIFTGEKE